MDTDEKTEKICVHLGLSVVPTEEATDEHRWTQMKKQRKSVFIWVYLWFRQRKPQMNTDGHR